MKRKLMLITVALLVAAFAPLLKAEVGSVSYTATYNQSPQLGSDTLGGITYTTVTYGDLFNTGDPGKPYLPVDYIKFSVPYNATNFTVSATISNYNIYSIAHPVYPSQLPYLTNGSTPPVITPPDNTVYNSGHYYPSISQMAWVADEGFLAGENHIVTVAVVPFSYQRFITNERLRMSQTVSLTLSYELNDLSCVRPKVRRDSVLKADGYIHTREIVVNPDSVVNNSLSTILTNNVNFQSNNTWLSMDTTSYPYLIITTPDLLNSLIRLVSLKRQKGYNVKVATMDEVINDPNANCGDVVYNSAVNEMDTTFTDNLGCLRQYLRNSYYNNNTRYVLLVGNNLPYRCLDYFVPNKGDTIYNIPSDLYLSDLDGNWTSESYDQFIDSYSELYVGRIQAKTDKDVKNYTDKLLRYELNSTIKSNDYRNSILFTNGYGIHSNSIMNMYSRTFSDSVKIYELSSLNYPSGADIVNTINEHHFGFISFNNHATPYGIITSKSTLPSGTILTNHLWAVDSIQVAADSICSSSQYNSGLNNLTNKMYPSIGYSVGSSTMPFDNQYNNEIVGRTFGDAFILGECGGPVFIGYTRDVSIYDALVIQYDLPFEFANANITIGHAFAKSRSNFSNSKYTQICYNLLGDPELNIWPYMHVEMCDPTISVIRYNNSIQITPYGFNRFAYCNNQGVIINSSDVFLNNNLINNVSPNGTVIAFSEYCYPYIAPLLLQNTVICNDQYVLANEVTAGNHIDNHRDNGNVVIPSGVKYEIEASGTVTLDDGFIVEKGASFAVYRSSF